MVLLLSQKDEIFEIIKDFSIFSPNQFDWFEDSDKESTTIQFKKTEYYFAFYSGARGFRVNFSPGKERLNAATTELNWVESTKTFNNWLFYLERELTTPNHWAKFKTQISGINFRANYDNEKFTYNEYIDLENKIELLKNQLDQLPLLAQQNEEIKNHLDRLSETAKDLGKYDWKNLFIGTILSIVMQLQVTPENATALWELIKSVFNTYFIE